MLIKNSNLANCKIVIGKSEPIKFDESGKAEIAPELGQELLKLKGYELVEEKKKGEPGADKKEKEPKEIVQDKKVEAEPENVDFETLSNNELKDLIKEKGEKAPSGATKADLVEILNNLEK